MEIDDTPRPAAKTAATNLGPPPRPRRRLSIGQPADLLASVPVVLGFVPSDSVVMLVLRGAPGPHARVDLARDEHLTEMARALVAPAQRHGVQQVALAIYAPLERGDAVAAVLSQEFSVARISVEAMVVADGHRWRTVGPGHRTSLAQEYDPLGHRFVAEAVVDGHVVLGSRDELVAGLRPDPELVERVAAADAGGVLLRTPTQVACLLSQAVDARRALAVEEVAALRTAVLMPEVRDAAWSWVTRDRAREHVDLWRHVLRACAVGEGTVPGAVLAFHAWLAGDGALAWCALARAGEGGGRTSLAGLVEDLLTRAVVPGAWSPLTESGEDLSGEDGGRGRGTGQVVDLQERRALRGEG